MLHKIYKNNAYKWRMIIAQKVPKHYNILTSRIAEE